MEFSKLSYFPTISQHLLYTVKMLILALNKDLVKGKGDVWLYNTKCLILWEIWFIALQKDKGLKK